MPSLSAHPQVTSTERDGEGKRADLTGAPGLLVFSGQRLVSHRCSPCPCTRRAWVFGANTKGGLLLGISNEEEEAVTCVKATIKRDFDNNQASKRSCNLQQR